jgi:regulator of replication initiation timing
MTPHTQTIARAAAKALFPFCSEHQLQREIAIIATAIEEGRKSDLPLLYAIGDEACPGSDPLNVVGGSLAFNKQKLGKIRLMVVHALRDRGLSFFNRSTIPPAPVLGAEGKVGETPTEHDMELVTVNAALLRLFKGEYRNSGDRHNDSLFVRDHLLLWHAQSTRLAEVEKELRGQFSPNGALARENEDLRRRLLAAEEVQQALATRSTLAEQKLAEVGVERDNFKRVIEEHAKGNVTFHGIIGPHPAERENADLRAQLQTANEELARVRETLHPKLRESQERVRALESALTVAKGALEGYLPLAFSHPHLVPQSVVDAIMQLRALLAKPDGASAGTEGEA